ncbi:response regulator [Flavobacterium sp.]|jgi:signal transduction histidine kinase/DNA-binding response OmpR family regulator|uniref:hybrid sensor histidine kinase/response regulator transcription factor n=1 Tax=Flavobacterium sp. TaxID=239 RepID=UPI0037C03B5A
MKKIVFLLFLFPFLSFSQVEKTIDSLQKIAKSAKNIDDIGNAYAELALIYMDNDVEKTQTTIDKLKALNVNNSCYKCEGYGWLYEGMLSVRSGDHKTALEKFKKTAIIAKKNDDQYLYIQGVANEAQTLMDLNKNKESEKLLLNFVEESKKFPDEFGMESIYFLLGFVNQDNGFYNSALDYFIKTDKLIRDDDPSGLDFKIAVLGQIADVYKELNIQDKANEVLNKALKIAKINDTPLFLNDVYLSKGIIELYFNNPNNAIIHLKKSYDYFKSINFKLKVANSALGLGECYIKLNDQAKSTAFLQESEQLFKEFEDETNLLKTDLLLAENYIHANKIDLATTLLNKIAPTLEKNKITKNYITYLNIKIKLNSKTQNFNKALKLIEKRDSIQNVINQKTNRTNFQDIETKYQTEKKEQEIKLLSAENELAKRQKYIYITLIGLLVLLGLSIFYLYRNKIKTANKISELNEMKSRFFANISHEFRTPLTLIKSPVQQLQATATDEKQRSQLNLVDKNADRMLELVDQLLELSKLDSGAFKLILKEGNLSDFLKSVAEPFVFQAKENKLLFHTNIQTSDENHFFDKDVIQKIVSNLLSNALKYTPENHTIDFSTEIKNENLHLSVTNAGVQLKNDDLPKLFQRFYQKTETQNGVGIGLALVKELVDLYQGTITTTLENDKLTFLLSLPLTISKDKNILIAAEQIQLTNNEREVNEELPILLLVDDNAQIRTVLNDLLSNEYKIIEAADGEAAFKLAQQEIPDCIISDVMMPKLDGFAFTKAIKSNELTSFVPVILLTAKTSEEAHLEALKSTADAFLTKPFNHNIVKATVQQLISERKKLQQRYSQELILKPVDIVINSVDEKFLKKLQTILDTQLANADFTAEEFATQIGISRMQLHRKLKSLLGVSATEFIRNERLKNAAELLKKGNGNISEIAYSVGFNEISYFSKCFKDYFGCSPTEYAEKK